MYNKRGISAIIATVMIILITVAAVGIVWVAIIPMIQDSLDFSSLSGRVSVLNKGYTAYDSVKEIAMVQVKRDVDEGVMNRIKITFNVEGNSHSSSVVAPASGNTKVYYFDMNGIGEPDSVSVAPIFAVGNREKEGDATSDVELPSSGISSSGIVYEIGRDYIYEMPMTGLVSWWKFDGDVMDSVGSNDLAIFGNANINGDVLVLDGVGDYVKKDVFNNAPLGNSPRTMMAWVKPVSYSTATYNRVVAYGGGCDAHGSMLSIKNNSQLSMAFWCNDAHQTTGTGLVLNEWNHAVFTYDGDKAIKFYIDGELVQDRAVNLVADTTSNSIRIGCTAGGTNCIEASLDDVMVYNRDLSDEEIKGIYEFQKKD
ncbi:LamG domain-containing protein [Candidatus Pacearchaeota archaeon]|nr:LamG domain-containing protein [Candidatus Pacearchaeota archaeon]